jgi:methionyl-tRNA synthetase
MIKIFCDACGQEIKPSELGNPLCTIQFIIPSSKEIARDEKNFCASCTAIIKDTIINIKTEPISEENITIK